MLTNYTKDCLKQNINCYSLRDDFVCFLGFLLIILFFIYLTTNETEIFYLECLANNINVSQVDVRERIEKIQ